MKIDLKVKDIQSSLISAIEYTWASEDNWRMKQAGYVRVTFQNGKRYIYEDVPFIIVMNIIAATDSIGERFNEFIKGGEYKYHAE